MNLKQTKLILLILLILIILGLFTNHYLFPNNKILSDNLREKSKIRNSISGSILLNYNVWIVISGKAEKDIFWGFKSTNNVSITVLTMNNSQYKNYKINRTFSDSFSLSNGSFTSGSGNFSVVYSDFWHIFFLNLDPLKTNTTLNFTVKFSNNNEIEDDNELNFFPNSFNIIIIISIVGISGLIFTILFISYRKKRLKNSFNIN